ncbi:hypothetical protein BKA81DRAFT_192159 [Phyllosticta paracitricarpa]
MHWALMQVEEMQRRCDALDQCPRRAGPHAPPVSTSPPSPNCLHAASHVRATTPPSVRPSESVRIKETTGPPMSVCLSVARPPRRTSSLKRPSCYSRRDKITLP